MSHPPQSIHPQFQKLARSSWRFRLFLWARLPLAAFAGVRLESLTDDSASASLKMGWRTQNPFRSIYFAALTMAAELTTGALGMGRLYKLKPSVSMLLVEQEAQFQKKALGKVVFTCNNGRRVAETIQLALHSGEAQTVDCHSEGVDREGDVVATFRLRWSFKVRAGNKG